MSWAIRGGGHAMLNDDRTMLSRGLPRCTATDRQRGKRDLEVGKNDEIQSQYWQRTGTALLGR